MREKTLYCRIYYIKTMETYCVSYEKIQGTKILTLEELEKID